YLTWLGLSGGGEWLPPAPLRQAGLFGHPNILAAYLNLLLPLALLALTSDGRRTTNDEQGRARRARWALFIFRRSSLGVWLGLALLAIFTTSSRGGWAATAVTLGLSGILLVAAEGGLTRLRQGSNWARWGGGRRRRGALALSLAALALVVLAGLGRVAV